MRIPKILFQFHKGTIKTFVLLLHRHDGAQFQFHKGTIKTETHREHRALLRDFNSIKVQLKQEPASLFDEGVKPFQFHKGTIKTILVPSLVPGVLDFNSIKVQLKRQKQEISPRAWQISIP